jgi:hypothetical protein
LDTQFCIRIPEMGRAFTHSGIIRSTALSDAANTDAKTAREGYEPRPGIPSGVAIPLGKSGNGIENPQPQLLSKRDAPEAHAPISISQPDYSEWKGLSGYPLSSAFLEEKRFSFPWHTARSSIQGGTAWLFRGNA